MESRDALDVDIQKLWLALKRQWLPGVAVFAVVVGLTIPLALSQKQKTDYEAKGQLLFKVSRTPSLTGVGQVERIDGGSPGGQVVGGLSALTQTGNPVSTEIEIVRSISLAQKTITALNLKDKKGKALIPEDFQKKLKAKIAGGTDVVEISYKGVDPKETAAVVNKLMSLYIEENLRSNRAELVAAQEFIAKQLPKAEVNVQQAETALRRFKEQNRVISLEEQARSAVGVIANLDEQISQVKASLQEANTRSAELQNKVGMNSQAAIATNSVNQSAGVQEALKEYQNIQAKLSVEQTRLLDDNPVIISLKEKQSALKNLLQERVAQTAGTQQEVPTGNLQIGSFKEQLASDFVKSEVERSSLASRLAQLTNTQAAYRQRLTVLPQLEKEQRELQRKLEAAQSTYQSFLKKLEELRLAENQSIGNARVIDPALVPEKRSSISVIITLLFGGAIAIMLAMVTIIFLEVRDRSLKTLKEVRDLFGYTLLATIPSFGKKTRLRAKEQERAIPALPVRDTPRSPISEAYRMLQANLKFLSSDKPPKVIVVTSSVPKEGKSTVSANLAAAMAQLGRRVLLVDGDLRHPSQHHIWELTNAGGLSDVLVGQAKFNTVVTEVMDNLEVLSCGVIPPNPLALLDSKRMAALIKDFAQTYDFVIIDAPPLTLAADALTLGKMTDGVLLVARPGVIDSSSATAAKESLVRSGQNVLGLVVNGVIMENESDSYFYYAQEKSSESNFTSRENVKHKNERYA
jgi:capsular exopolysaccharide synthesis family protein